VAMFAWAYNLKRVTADFLRALMVPHFTLKPTWAFVDDELQDRVNLGVLQFVSIYGTHHSGRECRKASPAV